MSWIVFEEPVWGNANDAPERSFQAGTCPPRNLNLRDRLDRTSV